MMKKYLVAAVLICASGSAAAAGPLVVPGRPLNTLLNIGGAFLNPLVGPITSISGPIAGNFVARVSSGPTFKILGKLATQPVRGVLLPTIVAFTPNSPRILPGLR